jgi:FkbM family methyltransferase
MLRTYRRRVVEAAWGDIRLRLLIADPVASEWYERGGGELPEIAILKTRGLRPGAVVFDLGAHQAVVALLLHRHVMPGGKVIALELNEHNVSIARENRLLNGAESLTILHGAASDQDGMIDVNLGLNGHIDDGQSGWGLKRVVAFSVDGLSLLHGHPDLLFIDVEGYEARVLHGARRSLARNPDCFVEVHHGCGLEAAGGSVEQVLGFFPPDRFERLVAPASTQAFRPLTKDSDVPTERFFLLALGKRASQRMVD